MNRWTLLIGVLAQAGAALSAQADPLSAGQQVSEAFLRGDVESVWTRSTPDMQEAFGSIDDLTSLQDGLLSDLGTEEAVLSERVEKQAGHDVFTRLSRWTDAPALIEIVIAFDDAEHIAGFYVRPQPVAADSPYLNYETKAQMRLPVDGEWYVYWGGRSLEDNYHAVDMGQRFALDLLVLEDGESHDGDDPNNLESYHCWGRPILAPAGGIVAGVVDGLPDQAIGSTDPGNPAGNHVVIDFGNDEYGFLAHLRQNSVRVAKGDHVVPGQEIGRCGNSGNTSEPHLHFHLQTGPGLGQGKGLPAQFTDYRANGVVIHRGEPRKGEIIQPVK
ncbi:M23 family metallopeptidase [Paracoccus onubensis]|uniref:M23 family metallopeptidase n=1 Tax=Paracoccus onubensis TaxID=1675788 RepID=A0A418T7U2_9RHOB|nr:M23 family metallopeptidase [Paracoccus onubensis]RJE89257.1 M23 family metallopeptidase [Paracoccus onubensis]